MDIQKLNISIAARFLQSIHKNTTICINENGQHRPAATVSRRHLSPSDVEEPDPTLAFDDGGGAVSGPFILFSDMFPEP